MTSSRHRSADGLPPRGGPAASGGAPVRPSRAGPDDAPAIAALVARAFAAYPYWTWAAPDPAVRQVAMAAYYARDLADMVALGATDVLRLDDGTPAAVAVWCRSDLVGPALFAGESTAVVDPAVGQRLRLAMGAMAAGAPTEPHWYLDVLATAPDLRRQGLATAVLAPGLGRADADGLPAYLETADPATVPFYQRQGFEVVGTTEVDGLPLWHMTRTPGGRPAEPLG